MLAAKHSWREWAQASILFLNRGRGSWQNATLGGEEFVSQKQAARLTKGWAWVLVERDGGR